MRNALQINFVKTNYDIPSMKHKVTVRYSDGLTEFRGSSFLELNQMDGFLDHLELEIAKLREYVKGEKE